MMHLFDVKYMHISKKSFRQKVRGTYTALSNIFASRVSGFQPLITFAKCFISNFCQDSEYASVMYIFVKQEMGTLSHRKCRSMSNTKCINTMNESNYSSFHLTYLTQLDVFHRLLFICILHVLIK